MLQVLTALFRTGVAGLACHLYRVIRRNIVILRFAGVLDAQISISRNKLAGHANDTNNSSIRK